MPSTRRRFVAHGSILATLLAGCANFGAESPDIVELEVELQNKVDNAQVFHLAIETSDGLGKWRSREVPANTSPVLRIEPEDPLDPGFTTHGVVDEQTGRAPVSIDTRKDEVCLTFQFEFDPDDGVQFFLESDFEC